MGIWLNLIIINSYEWVSLSFIHMNESHYYTGVISQLFGPSPVLTFSRSYAQKVRKIFYAHHSHALPPHTPKPPSTPPSTGHRESHSISRECEIHTQGILKRAWAPHEGRAGMSHIWMRHVTHLNEACHTCEWGMSHRWMRHVTHVNEACHTYEYVVKMSRYPLTDASGWLRLVGSLKLQVSFAKEPYKRDDILQKKPTFWYEQVCPDWFICDVTIPCVVRVGTAGSDVMHWCVLQYLWHDTMLCVAVCYMCCNVLQWHDALMCVAVCCSVLQCVAVCYSVLQCVAVCCSVLQCVAMCCSVFQWFGALPICHMPLSTVSIDSSVAVCCSVLQCVAVCCNVLQCVSVVWRVAYVSYASLHCINRF